MLARLPIKVSAPLLVAVPVLVVGVTLSFMWGRQSRHAVRELAHQNIEQIHALAATKVADVLSIPARICRINAHLVQSGMLDPSDLTQWREMLLQQTQALDMLSSVTWGGAAGRCTWVCRYADGSIYWGIKNDPAATEMLEYRLDDTGGFPDAPTNSFEFDVYERPWFRKPFETTEPAWSEPYVWVGAIGSEETTLGISYGIPLYDTDDTFIGVADADFTVTGLSDFLGSIQIGKTGVAAIVASDGRLIATSNGTPIIQGDGKQVAMADSVHPLFRAAAEFAHASSARDGLHAETLVGGDVHYLRTSPLGTGVGLEWTLVTIIPERDFLADIQRGLRRSSITSLFAVLAAIAIGIAAARWLVTPIVTLVAAVRRIGGGDLATSVDIRHAPEYSNLAQEINAMTVGLRDRMRMRESLSLAMEVQKNLLPSDAPIIKGLDIAGHSTYCDETGGDYYDFLDLSGGDEETAVIALGDVMGHGVAAAMLMATARGILRSRCAISGSLAELLSHLNALLVPDTRGHRFMTMQLVTLNAQSQELRWASAGHGPPIVYDADSDRFSEFKGGGIPLGIYDGYDYEEYVEGWVGPGCVVVSATDGLWETRDEQGNFYGMERLQELIRRNAHRSAEAISETIRDSLARHRGAAEQDDDLTFVIARVL